MAATNIFKTSDLKMILDQKKTMDGMCKGKCKSKSHVRYNYFCGSCK
jgi:hypothetical protein